MEKEKVVVLFSGGFDSVVLLNDLARNPVYDIHVLFFDYGQKNVLLEKSFATYWVERLKLEPSQCIGLTIPNLSWCESSILQQGDGEKAVDYHSIESQYVPMRNMIFASYALSYAESVGAKEIYLAILGGGTYPDTTPDFIYNLNEIAGEVGVQFITPFISHDKVYLYSRALSYGLVDGETKYFFSCNTPVNGKPCGMCADCKIISEMFDKPLDE